MGLGCCLLVTLQYQGKETRKSFHSQRCQWAFGVLTKKHFEFLGPETSFTRNSPKYLYISNFSTFQAQLTFCFWFDNQFFRLTIFSHSVLAPYNLAKLERIFSGLLFGLQVGPQVGLLCGILQTDRLSAIKSRNDAMIHWPTVEKFSNPHFCFPLQFQFIRLESFRFSFELVKRLFHYSL